MAANAIDGFEYFAFISYSSKDVTFAKKLQRDLERYHLPVLLSRRYPRTPRQISPIFRDKTDLEQGNLTEMLMRGLRSSKFLIVICSQHSAQPNSHGKRYIDLEVNSFVDLNPEVNKTRVIPIIYRKKGGARATACIPPAVKELDLLAIDVCDKGYQQTFNQVVSRMVGIKPGILWDRWRREARLRTFLTWVPVFMGSAGLLGWTGISALFVVPCAACIALGCGYAAWRYQAPRVECYARYIEENNLPVGIQKLTDEEVQHRQYHYRFTHRKGRLRKVECCNSAGVPVAAKRPGFTQDDISIIELYYDEKGHVSKHVWKDAGGYPVREVHFEKGKKGEWMNFMSPGGDFSASHQLKEADRKHIVAEARTAVTRYRLQRNAHGHVIGVDYCNDAGLPCCDSNGTWGRRFEIDAEAGVVTARYDVNRQGKRTVDSIGVSGRRYDYDANGNLRTYTNVDLEGKPIREKLGYAILRCTTDEHGNRTAVSYYAPDGSPCFCDDMKEDSPTPAKSQAMRRGMASMSIRYDDRGFPISYAYFDTKGEPCLTRYQIARRDLEYDAHGAAVSESYFGTDGKPCMSAGHCHLVRRTFDEYGNRCSTVYYDTKGTPCIARSGAGKQVIRYDENGRIRSTAYFDADDTPMLRNGMAHKTVFVHDEMGNTTETAYYGADGKPCVNKDGYAKVVREYDEHHNCVHGAYYGADGKPCYRLKTLVSSWTSEYDKRNNKISEHHFGIDGRPCLDHNGVAVEEWAYNDAGLRIRESFKGINGAPCLNKNGISCTEWTRDEMGNIQEARTYDTEGQLCCGKKGFAVRISAYDEQGVEINVRYLDALERPTAVAGAAEVSKEHDERRRLIRKRILGADGQATRDSDGIAEYRYEYDEPGNLTAESFYDETGLPCCSPKHYHRKERKYDAAGHHLETRYFGADGRPCRTAKGFVIIKYKRNRLGKPVETRYFDEQERPMKINGRALLAQQYDERGNRIGGQNYDEQNAPSSTESSGVSSYICEYDARDNKIRERCFGTDGKPCLNKNGSAVEEWEYNAFNQRTAVTYKGLTQEPVLCASGFCRRETEYDDAGRIICISHFDTEGKLCTATDPKNGLIYARHTCRYDRNNRIAERCYYDAAGHLTDVTNEKGKTYARITYTYETDEMGMTRTKAHYTDAQNQPITGK